MFGPAHGLGRHGAVPAHGLGGRLDVYVYSTEPANNAVSLALVCAQPQSFASVCAMVPAIVPQTADNTWGGGGIWGVSTWGDE